ncbi:hypothetical protein MBLNU459_g1513t1 [Dothideomycetes sp. NU459]
MPDPRPRPSSNPSKIHPPTPFERRDKRKKKKLTRCKQSSTCVPASNLLAPLRAPVCPLGSERYELRTRALGCDCSTRTLLSVLVTVLATAAGLALLYLLVLATVWALRIWGPGAWGGWEIEVGPDGKVTEGVWVRRNWWRVGGVGKRDEGLETEREFRRTRELANGVA